LRKQSRCAVAQVLEDRQLLALSDEDGWLSCVDTSSQLPTCLDDSRTDARPRCQWYAHHNAIFDIAWCKVCQALRPFAPYTTCSHREACECAATAPLFILIADGMRHKTRLLSAQDDTRIVTASGDMTMALWDTNTAQRLATFAGHKASVKSVSPWPACHDVLASGGRDGRICLFDGRTAGTYNYREGRRTLQGLTHAPVMQTEVPKNAYPGSCLLDPTPCLPERIPLNSRCACRCQQWQLGWSRSQVLHW